MLHCNIIPTPHLHPGQGQNESFAMSKQLKISTAFSVIAMTAFALLATPEGTHAFAETQTGATVHAAAPALDQPNLTDLAPVL